MDSPLGKGLESLIPGRDSSDDIVDTDDHRDVPVSGPAEEVAPVVLEDTTEGVPGAAISTLAPVVPVTSPTEEPIHEPAEEGPHTARTIADHFTPRRSDAIFWIDIGKIEPNPYQPRREFDESALKDLSDSIREHGLLQPIVVTKREIDTPTGLEVRYELIAGERRWRAATLAGLSQISAIIRRGVPDGKIKLELALIENIQREQLNPIERAIAYKRLIDEFKLMQREIGARVGKSREMVTNTLRLLTLPDEIQKALLKGSITEGHARAVLMAGEEREKQFQVFNSVLVDRLNVREAENKARQVSGRALTPRKRPSAIQDPEMRAWQNQLQEKLGTKVQLQKIGERGKIVVEFFSDEELKRIISSLAVREV